MREQRWELKYAVRKGDGWENRVCYPHSQEKVDENKAKIEASENLRLVSCKKMYPFDMWNNQHNFVLISNICYNRMHDMESGEIPFDSDEYDRLSALKDRADYLTALMYAPITWMVWDDLKDARELAQMAINHRVQACIENGRADLVRYC